jgi:DNA-binding response OmpR family regulator
MKDRRVLIVDDEKNIRFTISKSLESMDLETDRAFNGEEALEKLKEKDFDLMLLDLRMPGMDGISVLRLARQLRPDTRVIIVTAYGTLESAVEAMKSGAVDFIQKPFAPDEIRAVVSQIIDGDKLGDQEVVDNPSRTGVAERYSGDRHFDAAIEHVRTAITLDPSRPEALNLLGELLEIRKNASEAQKYFRAALSLDPTYKPARDNLDRSAGLRPTGDIVLEETIKGSREEE